MSDNTDIEFRCAERVDETLKGASEKLWYNDPDDDIPMLPAQTEAIPLRMVAMPDERGRPGRFDGTLKDASEIEWCNGPDDESSRAPPPSLHEDFLRADTPMDIEPTHRRSKARTQPRKQVRNVFLDLEAEVADDDLSGKDGNSANEDDDNFIDDADVAEGSDFRGRRQYAEPGTHQVNPFVEELERFYTDRGASDAPSTVQVSNAGTTLLPTNEGLWEARVPMGEETKIILNLASKAFRNEALIPHYPKSVFSRINLPGRIFFESDRFTPVQLLCEGIKGIDVHKIVKVNDPLQWVDYLLLPHAGYVPQHGTWVRMRRGVHKGDIAYVSEVHPRTKRPTIVYIPRIDYTSHKRRVGAAANPQERRVNNEGKNDDGAEEDGEEGDEEESGTEEEKEDVSKDGRRLKAARQPRPLAKLLDLYAVREHGLQISTTYFRHSKFHIFRGKYYDSQGFCFQPVDSTHYFPEEAFPTIEELHRFLSCGTISPGERQAHLRRLECSRMIPGTKVKIMDTEHKGAVGLVEGLFDDVGAIRIFSTDQVVRFPVAILRRHFQSGDFVRIIAGEHQGITGWIIHVYEEVHMAEIYDDRTQRDYSYPLHFLEAAEKDFRHTLVSATTKQVPEMRVTVYDRLVGMEALIVKGPHKGYWGHIHSTTMFGEANISMQGKHVHTGRLERVQVSDMLYRNRQVNANWHQFTDKGELVIVKEAQHLISISLVDTTYPDVDEFHQLFFPTHTADVLRRVEERDMALPSSSPWEVDELDEQNAQRPETMGTGHWLSRLSALTVKPLRIYFRVSQRAKSKPGVYKYAGEKGFFKALSPPNVTMGFENLPDIDVPFKLVEPFHPDRPLLSVLVLELGDLFGKRMVVSQYPGNRQDTLCTVREAPRQGKRTHPLPTYKVKLQHLTVCSEI